MSGYAVDCDGNRVKGPPVPNVLKPHGSCNWIPPSDSGAQFGHSADADVIGEPLLIFHDPVTVVTAHRKGMGPSPAMSLYAPGKHSPISRNIIERVRDWAYNRILTVDVVLVIGACPRLADGHVFGALAETQAAVMYVGGDEALDEFRAARGARTFARIGTKFLRSRDAIDDALARY